MNQIPLPIPDQKKKLRRRRILASLVIGFAILLYVLFNPYGIWTRYKLERNKNTLADSLQSLRVQQDSLRLRIKLLQTSTYEVERIARERYGMVKPGEQVYIIKKDSVD